MRTTHIRNIDLGLLAALQALVEERSITRASDRMFLSQPAMSRIFDRLQDLFSDELLVRSKQGYEPTPRALQIYAELGTLLPRLNGLLQGNSFDLKTANNTFRIAATDFATSVLFPDLMERVGNDAPHISLDIAPWDDAVFRKLETSALDLALWANNAPNEFKTERLFTERHMCLVRNKHPVSGKRLSLERYLAYPHALVTLANQRQGVIDKALEDKGIHRRVQLRLPYFASAAWAIEHSDMILTVPERLASRLVKISDTRMLKPPVELADFDYIQVWHPRMEGDPAHQWLRRILREIAAAC